MLSIITYQLYERSILDSANPQNYELMPQFNLPRSTII